MWTKLEIIFWIIVFTICAFLLLQTFINRNYCIPDLDDASGQMYLHMRLKGYDAKERN